MSTESRKALNFDLNSKLLKDNYPSKHISSAYRSIRRFLERYGFTHRQKSGYVSRQAISMADVGSIISEMAQSYTWLQLCIQQLDVTIVGDEYSFLDYLRKSPGMDEF